MNRFIKYTAVLLFILLAVGFRFGTVDAISGGIVSHFSIVEDEDVDEDEDSSEEDDDESDEDDEHSEESDEESEEHEEDSEEEHEYSGTNSYDDESYNYSIPYMNGGGFWIYYWIILYNSDHQPYYECFNQSHQQISCNRSTS